MSRALLIAAVLAAASSACAGGGGLGVRRQALTSPRPNGFEVDVLTDAVTTAGMAAVGILMDRQKEDWRGQSPCPEPAPVDPAAVCDARAVPALDRPVTRLGWGPARRASDVAVLGMLALPFAVSAADTGAQRLPAENVAVDGLVIGQTLSATLLATSLLKVMARRARPFTYNPDFPAIERHEGDARLSFPSGHSSLSFAAASVTAVMLLRRYPGPGGVAGAVGAYLGASGVATLRVLAGKHFISDVLVGAALGTALGLAFPLAHARDEAKVGETAAAVRGQDRALVPVLSFGGVF